MDNLHTLQRLQGELNEEMHRLTLLRDVFQAQHCADELDAASHLEAAHIAHCSARRSSQRIREIQSLVALLRHGGPRRCEECGEDIPLARLMLCRIARITSPALVALSAASTLNCAALSTVSTLRRVSS